MFSNATEILNEVKKRADASNHVIQLFSIELYKKIYFQINSFENQNSYVNLHKQRHRLQKMMELSDYFDWDDIHALEGRREGINVMLQKMKLERKEKKDSFIYNFLMDERIVL